MDLISFKCRCRDCQCLGEVLDKLSKGVGHLAADRQRPQGLEAYAIWQWMLVISPLVGGPEVQPPQAKSEAKGRMPWVLVFLGVSWCPGIILWAVPLWSSIFWSSLFLSLFLPFTHQKPTILWDDFWCPRLHILMTNTNRNPLIFGLGRTNQIHRFDFSVTRE